ncbi:MAG: ABC transporter ATP-binding protein [Thermoplasmata archaeon]
MLISSAPSVIQVRDLVKRYQGAKTAAVDGISLEVGAGEFVAFLGPNGAGKSTTISILTTSLAKTSGSVRVAGFDLDTSAREIRASIGIIFQNPSLDLRLTAEENLRFHVALYGLYGFRPAFRFMPQAYRDQVKALARMLGIEKDLFRVLGTFSGGMRRKLEIVRSLMHKPKILFLDEPTQGLDPISRQSLWSHLRKVQREEKTTIFLTTHYIEEAEGADRVFIVSKGRLLYSGTPDAIKVALTDRYLELDAPDRELLTAELGGADYEALEDGSLKVRFAQPTPQELLSRITTPLSKMRLHTPTLEEAYIEKLGREEAPAEGVGT